MIEAAIRQVTVFVITVLALVNMSSGLMDVAVSPVVALTTFNVVPMNRNVRKVEFLMVEICGVFILLMFDNLNN